MCILVYAITFFRETTHLGMKVHSSFLNVFLAHCPVIHLEAYTGAKLAKVRKFDKLVSVRKINC